MPLRGQVFLNKALMVSAPVLLAVLPGIAAHKGKPESKNERVEITGKPVLWQNPGKIGARNLYFGAGGPEDRPRAPFEFQKEDLDGSSPKFTVLDAAGVKWKVKLGAEAQPETAASRLVWAVGYFVDEEYFVPDAQIQELPVHLHRGREFVGRRGLVRGLRFKREPTDEKKLGVWQWRNDPFSGTRELNGLRVMMALINNWDVKDINNAIRQRGPHDGSASPERVYLVSDLGGTFGTPGADLPKKRADGNLPVYAHSKFITKVTGTYVDFAEPARPSIQFLLNPPQYWQRWNLRWIGKRVPREDVAWMARILAQLSSAQIHDAFRAAGYSPEDIDGFSGVVEERIKQLNSL